MRGSASASRLPGGRDHDALQPGRRLKTRRRQGRYLYGAGDRTRDAQLVRVGAVMVRRTSHVMARVRMTGLGRHHVVRDVRADAGEGCGAVELPGHASPAARAER